MEVQCLSRQNVSMLRTEGILKAFCLLLHKVNALLLRYVIKKALCLQIKYTN